MKVQSTAQEVGPHLAEGCRDQHHTCCTNIFLANSRRDLYQDRAGMDGIATAASTLASHGISEDERRSAKLVPCFASDEQESHDGP